MTRESYRYNTVCHLFRALEVKFSNPLLCLCDDKTRSSGLPELCGRGVFHSRLGFPMGVIFMEVGPLNGQRSHWVSLVGMVLKVGVAPPQSGLPEWDG